MTQQTEQQARAALAALIGYEPDEHDAKFEEAVDAYRAAVLREAADAVDAMNQGCSRRQPCASCNAREDAADALRRMAEEARS